MTKRAGIVLGAAWLLLAAPGVAAAGDRVALFPFEGHSLPRAVEMSPLGLGKAVRDRLVGAGHSVMEPALLLPDLTAAVGCAAMDGDCATRLGAYLGVTHLVVGRLTGTPAGVRIEIEKWRAADGAREARVEETLPGTVTALTAGFDALALKAAAPGAAALPVARLAPAPAPAPAPARAPLRGSGLLPAILVAGLGVAALGASLGTGLRTSALQSDYDAIALETAADFEEALVLERRGKRFARATAALLAVGGAAVLAGGALLAVHLLGPRGGGGGAPALVAELGPTPRLCLRVAFGAAPGPAGRGR